MNMRCLRWVIHKPMATKKIATKQTDKRGYKRGVCPDQTASNQTPSDALRPPRTPSNAPQTPSDALRRPQTPSASTMEGTYVHKSNENFEQFLVALGESKAVGLNMPNMVPGNMWSTSVWTSLQSWDINPSDDFYIFNVLCSSSFIVKCNYYFYGPRHMFEWDMIQFCEFF